MKKRIISMLLSIVMVFTMLPAFSLTASAATTYANVGEGLTATLNNGTLTISGNGAMNDFGNSYGTYAPWYNDRRSITNVVIEEGVTSIGTYAFYWCEFSDFSVISIPKSLKSINESAFYWGLDCEKLELPVTIESIGSKAFYGCGLEYVSYGVDTIVAEDAFASNTYVTYYSYTHHLYYQADDVTNVVLIASKFNELEAPSVPERPGFIFGGWYTDAACSDANAIVFPYKPTANTSLYAKWTVDENYDPDHTHEWSYEVVEGESKIKATCIAADCKSTDGGSVSISAVTPVPAYTGSVLDIAELTNELKYTPDSLKIVYTQNETEVEPKNAGTYTATITLDTAKVSVECKIEKGNRPSAPDAPTMESFTGTSLTLKAQTGCEYSMNGTDWQESPTFVGLTTGNLYSFYARYAESDNQYASPSSKAVSYILGQNDPIEGTLTIKPTNAVDTITKGTDYTYSNGVLTVKTATPVTIGLLSGVAASTDQIFITGVNADITLDNVKIEMPSHHKFASAVPMSRSIIYLDRCPAVTLRIKGTVTLNNLQVENGLNRGIGFEIFTENNAEANLTITGNGILNIEASNYSFTDKGQTISTVVFDTVTANFKSNSAPWAENMTIQNGATVKMECNENMTFGNSILNPHLTVIPAAGKVYQIDSGDSETEAVSQYYAEQSEVCIDSKYFLAKSIDHVHTWVYSLKEGSTDTIIATCGADGCPDTNGGRVTLAAPDSTEYTGSPIEAKVTDELTTGDTVTVVYTGENLVSDLPVKIGTYTATLTVGEDENAASVSVTYMITHSNHSFNYTDKEGSTHTASCDCGYSETVPHDYKYDEANHKCICEKVEQFEITYTDGVDGVVIFDDKVISADYGAPTPSFGTNPTRADYLFSGWNPTVAEKVTGAQIYTAHWTEKAAVNITETPQTYEWDGTAKNFDIVGTELIVFKVEYFVNGAWTETAPSDAGEYNVRITRAEDDTYKAYSKEIDAGLVINPADISVEATGIDGWTYSEDADTPTVVVKFNGNKITSGYGAVTYTYYTDANCTVKTTAANSGASTEGGVPVNAGTYYVKASVAAAGNYNGTISDAVSFTIAQKSISGVTVSEIANQTYTGEALTPGFAVKDGETTLTENVDYTVVYDKNIDAGEAIVTISGIGNYKDRKEVNFQIIRADWATKTASGAAMYNTTGNELDLTSYIAPGGTVGTPAVNAENILTNVSVVNGTLTYDVLANVTADSVTVTIPVNDATNHENYEITVTINLSVKPSQIITVEDVTEDKLTFTYGDTDAAISADSNIDGAEISYAVTEGDCISVDASTGKITINKVGTAVITVTAAETDTYAKTTKTVTVEIKAKQIAAPSADSTVFTYNGYEHTYGISATDDYSVSGNKQTNAGNYTVIVELTDKANTVWADNKDTANKEYAFHIAKATLTVTADDKEAYVGSRMPELTYTVDGLFDGDSISVELSCDANMNRIGETPIVVTATDASGNYEITTVNGTLTVKMFYIPIIPSNPTYPPVVDDPDNGDVVVTPKNPEKGDTVTIIPDPDAGYEVDEVIVTDKNCNPVTVIDNGDGTYSFVQPNGKVNIEVTFKEITKVCPRDWTCPMYGYTDLDRTLWYHDGIHFCIENNLMQGIGNNEFAPNGTTTRAMIVTILWRLEGSPVVNYAMDFEDVAADQWYTEAIRWAASEKIVEGYGNGKFGTNDAITREQMVTIMFRYAKYKGYDVSVGENTNILSYDDAFDVAEWAIPAMQWACGSGMIQGIADGNQMNLVPQGNATRAQAAAILQRYCENVANKD